MSFEELGLAAPLLQTVTEEGYSTPTPIQAQAIPHVIAGKDLLGCAQTGTGKTAAFALPMLHQMMQKMPPRSQRRRIRGLVLSPTRELAAQIGDSLRTYGRNTGVFHTVVFGGVNQFHQVRALSRGVDILVATPGRLQDLMEQGHIQLDAVEFFVLDEADRMLDMGFMPDIERIVPVLPKERQTLFFSATMPGPIRSLADSLLTDPVRVEIEPVRETTDLIDQSVCFCDAADKGRLLVSLIKAENCTRSVVFARTKMRADRVVRRLQDANISVDALHSDKSQSARQRALFAFKSSQVQVLVATDIAARGLDVDNISHVFNFDMPQDAETYIHRIGRTGRAGQRGTAISFVSRDERGLLSNVQYHINQRLPLRSLPEYLTRDDERPANVAQGADEAQNAAAPQTTGEGEVAQQTAPVQEQGQPFGAPSQYQPYQPRFERRGNFSGERRQFDERRPRGQKRPFGGQNRERSGYGESFGGGGRGRGPRDAQRQFSNDRGPGNRYEQAALPPDSIAPAPRSSGYEAGDDRPQNSYLYVSPNEVGGYQQPSEQGRRFEGQRRPPYQGGPRRGYFADRSGAAPEGGQFNDGGRGEYGHQQEGGQYGRRPQFQGNDQGQPFWPKRRRENEDQGQGREGGYRQGGRFPGQQASRFGGGGNGPRGDRRPEGGYAGQREGQGYGGQQRGQGGGGYQQGPRGQRPGFGQGGGGFRKNYGQGGGFEQNGGGGYGRAPFRKKSGGSAPRYS